jgi:hypothetical protein
MAQFDVAVLRSTWNYVPVRDAFCAWCEKTSKLTRFFNPPSIVRFSTDKSYLRELTVPTVPTIFDPDVRNLPWRDVVIKPRISAGSFATRRFHLPAEIDAAEAFLFEHAGRAMMAQPYMNDVESGGEKSIMWIDGEITHAVRKRPRFSDGHESVSDALFVMADERAIATRALEPFANQLLYARVDVVRDEKGELCIMELELVEPSLFLTQHPPAAERLARATLKRTK